MCVTCMCIVYVTQIAYTEIASHACDKLHNYLLQRHTKFTVQFHMLCHPWPPLKYRGGAKRWPRVTRLIMVARMTLHSIAS